MSCFEILEISVTKDIKTIKQAYARLIKIHHPEDDPKGFQQINEAYQQALSYAKAGNSHNFERPVMPMPVKTMPASDFQKKKTKAEAKADTKAEMATDVKAEMAADANAQDMAANKYFEELERKYADTGSENNSAGAIYTEDQLRAKRLKDTMNKFNQLFLGYSNMNNIKIFFESEDFKEFQDSTKLLHCIVAAFEHDWMIDISVWRYVKSVLERGGSAANDYQLLMYRYLTAYRKREKECRKEQLAKLKKYIYIGAAVVLLIVLAPFVNTKERSKEQKEESERMAREAIISESLSSIQEAETQRMILDYNAIFQSGAEELVNEENKEYLFTLADDGGEYSVKEATFQNQEQNISYLLRYPKMEGSAADKAINEGLRQNAVKGAQEAVQRVQLLYEDEITAQVDGRYYIAYNGESRLSVVFTFLIMVEESSFEEISTVNYIIFSESENAEIADIDISTMFLLNEGEEERNIQFYFISDGIVCLQKYSDREGYREVVISWADYYKLYSADAIRGIFSKIE